MTIPNAKDGFSEQFELWQRWGILGFTDYLQCAIFPYFG